MDLRTTEEILAIKAEFRKMTGINPDSPNTINELMRFTYDFLIEKFKERHNALMKHNKELEVEIKHFKKRIEELESRK